MTKTHCPRQLILFLLTSIFISNSYQARASDFQSPRTAALGGAGHAGPLLTDAIYLNPSYVSFLESYAVSANYGEFHGGSQDSNGNYPYHGHILNAAVQDGRSDLFQAGVGATIKDDAKIFNVGASKALLKSLGIGIGGKWISPNTGNGTSAQDAIVSTTFVATSWVQFAAIVDNARQSTEGMAQGLYREYIGAMKLNAMNIGWIYFDPHLAPSVPNMSSFGQETGAELQPMQDFFIRGGYFRNSNIPELRNTRGSGYGFGLGLIAEKVSFDYALKRATTPVGDTMNTFGITIFF